MNTLKAYDRYKDSGIPWLRSIPEGWEIKPGLAIYREKKIKNKNLIEKTILSLSYGRIIIKPKEKLTGLLPESFETYQIVTPWDIIIRSTDMQNDHTSLRTGFVKDKGVITSAYICLESLEMECANFNHWQLHGFDLMKIFYGLGSGLRQNLSWNDFKRLLLPIPPFEEQQKIAHYLDWQSLKINKFIKAKKRLILLLKEQKQNIINHAVTKGTNPNVKMKDSGVEWLGEIPEHWEVKKVKYCLTNVNIQCDSCASDEIYLALENIEGWSGKIKIPANKIEFDSKVKKYKTGDILFGKLRPYLAKVALPDFNGVCVGEFLVLRKKGLLHEKFFCELLRSKKVIDLINSSTFGARMPRADWDFIGSISVGVPSKIEQEAIVNYIEKETALIDKTISRTEREIEFIQEYRTRLISDVVTGKVDVRSVNIQNFEIAEVEEEILEDTETDEDELMMEEIEE